MEELWQFPYSWGVVDGCHIPIKCPPGGAEACKEYHNFKNFYSIVLMSIVDAKYRFMCGSCGFPGNSHDSIIFQSTSLWSNIKEGNVIPSYSQNEQGVYIPSLLLVDSAFPMETWLMKPYSNAVLTKDQRYFNYRPSRARMVVEGGYGQLKGRCSENLKAITIPAKLDLTIDAVTGEKRDRTAIRDILLMKSSDKKVKLSSERSEAMRKKIRSKLMKELSNTTTKYNWRHINFFKHV